MNINSWEEIKQKFREIRSFFKEEDVVKRQTARLEKALDQLILAHENKRLTCGQIIVGNLYKQLVKFDPGDFFYDEIRQQNFLGSWHHIPVFVSDALYDSKALAMSMTLGFPMTSTLEVDCFHGGCV